MPAPCSRPDPWKQLVRLAALRRADQVQLVQEARRDGDIAGQWTLLHNDLDGDTKLAIDQPSRLFASYGDPRITDGGRELDTHLARLVTLLGGEVPPQRTL
ncbi:hypothetical protein [Streptomyces sp. NBC_01589]|uniref:hypothetical protein n=1 Tax=unclassified Streptomyces TaxID=2593676 RepID=UPI00386C82E3